MFQYDDNFLSFAYETCTYNQTAYILGIHTEFAMIKSQLLNIRCNRNVPCVPISNL